MGNDINGLWHKDKKEDKLNLEDPNRTYLKYNTASIEDKPLCKITVNDSSE